MTDPIHRETLAEAMRFLAVHQSFSDKRKRPCRVCHWPVLSVLYHNGVQLYTRWLDNDEWFITHCPHCGVRLSASLRE